MFGRYERLRLARCFPESIKARLREDAPITTWSRPPTGRGTSSPPTTPCIR